MYGLVSKLFRAYGLYNTTGDNKTFAIVPVSKLFRAYGLYNVVQELIEKILD